MCAFHAKRDYGFSSKALLRQAGGGEGLVPGRAGLRPPDSPVLQNESDVALVVEWDSAPPRAAHIPNLCDNRISLAADPLNHHLEVFPDFAGRGDPVVDEVFAQEDLAFEASNRA